MILAEVISGTIALGLSLLIFTMTTQFPSLSGGLPGPALFPYLISCMLGFFSSILIISGLFPSRARQPLTSAVAQPEHEVAINETDTQTHDQSPESPASKHRGLINMALVILGMMFFALFLEKLGFILTGLILCIGLMWRMGVSLLKAIGISFGTVMLIFWLFAKLMLIPLPLGVIPL